MVNGIRVIDIHCHIYPPSIAEKAVGSTDAFYGVKSYHDGTVKVLERENARAGIDLSGVCSVATTHHQVSSINRFIARETEASGGRFFGVGTLYPDSPDIAADVEEAIALGLRGIKLHPDIQGFKLDDYRCLKIYELCEGRLPVLLHTGDKRYDYSNPNRLIPLLETYTGLRVIGAHFGCYSLWETEAEKLYGYPNFWVDCSSSMILLPDETTRSLIRGFGADRVLFGTDYPMWTPKDVIDKLLGLGLGREELELILHKNAETVFDLA